MAAPADDHHSLPLPDEWTCDDADPWTAANPIDAPLGSHIASPRSPHEDARLATLRAYRILDTEQDDPVFVRLTNLLAEALGTEIALISLVDRDRQWFKAEHGLGASETTRAVSFCSWAIVPEADPAAKPFVVPDATRDARFAGSPLVQGAPNIRFYAGIPLVAPNMMRLGTMCVISSTPRAGLGEREADLLAAFGGMVMRELETRRLATASTDTAALEASLFALPPTLRVQKALQRISHEIRTPLHTVIGSAELLQLKNMSDGSQRLVTHIHSAALDLLEKLSTIMPPDQSTATFSSDRRRANVMRQLELSLSDLEASLSLLAVTNGEEEEFQLSLSSKSIRSAAPTAIAEGGGSEAYTGLRPPGSIRALVVDDVALNIMILTAMLGNAGLKGIVERDNGLKAYEAVVASDPPFDVVFLDLQMPVMGGTEAAFKILSHEGLAYPPYLVAVTADTSSGVRDRCAAAGFNEYLSKPVVLESITSVLDDVRDYIRPFEEMGKGGDDDGSGSASLRCDSEASGAGSAASASSSSSSWFESGSSSW